MSTGHSRRPRRLPAAACLCVALGVASRVPDAAETRPAFIDAADQAGLRFVHENGATGRYFMPELLGAGVAVFDYDNDGDLDVYLVQDAAIDGSRPHTGNRLFRNDGVVDGVPRFSDVTSRAGVGLEAYGMGVAVGDVDNDGFQDLFLTAVGRNVLYRNRGDGTFEDVTARTGVGDSRWGTSAAFLDYDRDGDLDLFVANYVDFTVAGNKVCTDQAGARDHCPPGAYMPLPPRLFRNEGGLTFTNVTESSGVARAYGAGLGVAVGDLDMDGWPDIYVANDATPNQLWMNKHDGTFEDRGLLSGTAFNALGRPEGSMGIALGDADGDGDEDLFVTNITGESHVLYLNDGRANFDDARGASGIGAPTASMTGFGTNWLDYDHDGRLDLFITNGAVNIIERLRGKPAPYVQTSQLLHNEGKGRFRDVSSESGPAFARLEVGRGAAFGDIDNDGDIDILVTNNNGPVRLLLNGTNAPGGSRGATPRASGTAHWLEVALRAPQGNRFGIGARVGVLRAGMPTLWRRARSDGSYLSASDSRVHFGLGVDTRVTRVIVEWPDGAVEAFRDIPVDQVVPLERGRGTAIVRRGG